MVPQQKNAARKRRLADLITAYHATPGRSQPDILRAIAAGVVELRSLHTLGDVPDWSGRSSTYRADIAEVYRMAHIPEGKEETFRTALRYHVGNLLRERLAPDELEDAGMSPDSPRARATRTRDAVSAVVAAVSDPKIEASDTLRFLVVAEAILARVAPPALATLPQAEQVAAEASLDNLAARVDALRARAGGQA